MSAGISAATAAIVGGGLSAVGSIVGGLSSQSAADTQASAQQQAAQVQWDMFNTINQQEQPFIQSGGVAGSALNKLLGLDTGGVGNLPNGFLMQGMAPFDASTFSNSPGYQFAQSQGLQQVMNADAPAVGALSGPALKDLTNYATGTAARYYNDYFNQYNTQFNQQQTQQNNIFSRLSAIAGLGQNAASQVGNAGAQLGTGAAQAVAGAGASQAAGTIGTANAIAGGLNNAGSYLTLGNMLSQGGGSNPTYGTTAAGNPIYFTAGS